MTRRLGVLAGVALFAACASAPAQPRAVDPVGMFDFSTHVDGTAVTGTISIEQSGNGHTGMITTSATEPVAISGVAVEGQQLTVTAQTPDGPVTMILVFTGNTFTGSWSYAGMSGTLTGQRRAQS